MSDHQRLAGSILCTDLYAFVQQAFRTLHAGEGLISTWHVEAMAHRLERVARGECRRLIITVPPRHLKSVCGAVAFPAWLLGQEPGLRLLVASYGADLAAKHARDFRTVIESGWYQSIFPRMRINPRVNREMEITTTLGGGRKAVSLGGAVTGFGADIVIVDDLMKAGEAQSPTTRQAVKDYYEQTLYSRLNDKRTGRIVVLQQRLHEDDFAGYLLDKASFEHLNLRAIAEEDETHGLSLGAVHRRARGEALFPAREPLEVLEQIRADIGSYAFSAQYQQNPVPPEGNRVRWSWFGTYEAAPRRDELLMVVQSWDPAITAEPTSDFSVCTTWGLSQEQKWLLLDIYRARIEYPTLRRRVQELRACWRADEVIIERTGPGIPLVSEFHRDLSTRLQAYTPRVDKETRFAAQTAKIERGDVLLPEDAPWLSAFKQEILAFPNGRHDDQVDSLAQFLDWTDNRRGRCRIAEKLNGGVRPRVVNRWRR